MPGFPAGSAPAASGYRGEVDHTVELLGLQCLHQRVATEAQHQVEFRLADFQQQVGVAGQARDQAGVGVADVEDDRTL